MGVSESEIQAFTNFLRREAANGGADLTIPKVAAKWQSSRETADIVAAVNEGRAEFAAGGGRPAADVVADVRKKLATK